ncbi:MAG: CinA family protein [Candidatus Hydrogenedentes bacterium]|nr:CinA family protein [Candidatus Hydrogenedentota bacterium]
MPESLLEKQIGDRLTRRKETVASAESCSGGLIAHRITNVAGSSAYFQGGVVTYSNQAKCDLLGVKKDSILAEGAVSDTVARQMAEGARARFLADWGVGVTGIAGPTGGTPEKPVGLVYVAVSGKAGTTVQRCMFNGNREEIKSQTANTALQMILEQLA